MLLRFIHKIGLTNLSDDDVDSMELHSLGKKIKHRLSSSKSNVKINFIPHFDRYFQSHLTVDELGVIERDMKDLKRVIVIANQVEKPHSSLEEAVDDNFNEGIQYLFLVSKSKAETELESYYTIFEARAKIVAKKLGIAKDSLIQIKRLPFDWDNYPYILYQCERQGDSSQLVTYAFRGNEVRRGISHSYESVVGEDAHTIALTVTAGAPSDIREEVAPINNIFEDGDRSIRLAVSNVK